MTKQIEKQIKGVLKRQKKLAILSIDPIERAEIYGAWAGFLGGMKLAGVITKKEYDLLYEEMINSQNTKTFNTKEAV